MESPLTEILSGDPDRVRRAAETALEEMRADIAAHDAKLDPALARYPNEEAYWQVRSEIFHDHRRTRNLMVEQAVRLSQALDPFPNIAPVFVHLLSPGEVEPG